MASVSPAEPPYDQAATNKERQPPYPTKPSQNPGAYPPQSSAGAYPPASYPPPVQTAPGSYPLQQQGYYAPGNYPPQQQVYYAPGTYPAQQQGGTVIVTQPAVVAVQHNNQYGYVPVNIKCPMCHQQTITKVSYKNNGLVWMSCGITALFGCICGCCLIPFFIDSIKDVAHTCDKCGSRIGYRRRLD